MAISYPTGLTASKTRGVSLPGGLSYSGITATINKQDRNIASGVRVPGYAGALVSNGTNTTQNLRSAHFNESGVALTEVQLGYGGWYADLTNESINANAYTITASIEYPAATFTQVTWDVGSTSKSIPAGPLVLSDYVSVNIPAGAQFWVRTFVSVSGGETWPLCGSLVTALGELGEFAVGGSDKTMGGTISGSSGGLRPATINARWKTGMKKSFASVGDSNSIGTGDGFFDTHGNTGYIGRSATGNCPYLPIGVGGTTLAAQVLANKMQYRIDLITKAGIEPILCDFGVNDGADGYSTITANLTTLWALLKAIPYTKVRHTTLGPRSSVSANTRGYYKNSTQTANSFFNGSGAVGNLVNGFIRATTLIDGYFEYADTLSSARDSGIWRNGDEQPHASLLSSETLNISGIPTTTSVPTDTAKATQYYLTGSVYFITGVLAGTTKTSGVSNTTSTLTFSSALASAPTAGDTCTAFPAGAKATSDGLHPAMILPVTPSGTYGGHAVLRDVFTPILQGWV